jgi:type IV pilus assembly protein PilY1
MNKHHSLGTAAAFLLLAGYAGQSRGQTTFTEDFTQGASAGQWYYFNGACLTAGTGAGSGKTGTTAGYLPSCMSILSSYYGQQHGTNPGDPVLNGGYSGTLPDPAGNGALRFTNGSPYGKGENGAIVSSTPFNAGNGLKISFKTITYRGDGGGSGADGADGLSFYLLDATTYTPTSTPAGIWNGIGSFGGSLAYTCSNVNPPYDGVVAGYLAVGIDEYGNFLNGESLMPGYTGPNVATGDNTALGYGAHAGRIGLRGPGSVAWKYLNSTDKTDYPDGLSAANQQTAVQNTCKSGLIYHNVQNGSSFTSTPTTTAIADYAPIPNAYSELPSGYPIANEAAQTRPDAAGNGATTGNTIVYNLMITQAGLLTFNYSYNGGALQTVVNGQDISTTAAPLPASLLFAFAGSSGGDTNIHEILCFQAAPQATSSSSSTTDQQQTGEVQTNAQANFAFYDPSDWTGRLTAFNIIDTNGVLSIASLANWDAQCVLTGLASSTVSCPTTGTVGPVAAEDPASRVMLTWNGTDIDTGADEGTSGIPFEWPPNTYGSLATAEQNVIDAGDTGAYTTGGAYNGNRVNYLRGDRSNEITTAGTGLFRRRDGVLGDIVDSSPTWVGPPSSPYVLTWSDRFDPSDVMAENTGQSYSSFQAAEQGRLNVVYVGANDGFLHGFRSGSETAAGDLVTTSYPNDGQEVLAYMPGSVLETIHNATNRTLDYSSPSYVHNFFVDATPGAGDLFFNGAWHTWLVGGLGAGGAAIYALDVTDPATAGSTRFSEKNASTVVVGEWSATTIACAIGAGGAGCGVNLGNTYGTPLIRRLHNGLWGVIFGNGYGSASGDAGIFVMTIDQSGNKTFYYLSTGTAGSSNGIGYVTAADLDGDHITDFVYAGDLLGNVWRFDLSACAPTTTATGTCTVSAGWGVNSNSATGKPVPLFTDPAGQPITTPVVLASFAASPTAAPQLLVSWGTGRRTQVTTTSGVAYASGLQSLYGVWDWNLSTWNLTSTSHYATLTAAQENCGLGKGCNGGSTTAAAPLGAGNLQQQTFTDVGTAVDTTNLPVTWITCSSASPSTCSTDGVFGWFANLPASGEQIVSAPTIYQQSLIVNSTIPANNSLLSCTVSSDKGNTYVLSVTSGGTFVTTSTGSSSGGSSSGGSSAGNLQSGFMNSNGDHNMVGQQTNETGSATVLNTKEGTTWFYGQSITPTLGQTPTAPTQLNLPPNIAVNRITWVELR